MTYGELVQAAEIGLPELLTKPMAIKAAMRVRVLNRKVRAELETFHEMRQKLIEEHAQRDDNDKLIVDETGNVQVAAAFWPAFHELMTTDAPAIEPIRAEDLGDITVTPQSLATLGDLLSEE